MGEGEEEGEGGRGGEEEGRRRGERVLTISGVVPEAGASCVQTSTILLHYHTCHCKLSKQDSATIQPSQNKHYQ